MSTPVIKKTWSLVVLLTTGLVIFYLIIAVCVFSIFSSLLHPSHHHSKAVVTTKTGEVLIMHTEHSGNEYEQYYTDLDDNHVETTAKEIFQTLDSINWPGNDDVTPELYRSHLIFPFRDYEPRPRTWYLIVEQGEDATGYFEVYDPVTSQRLFFVGQQGRMETAPSPKESFQLPHANRHLSSVLLKDEDIYHVEGVHGAIPSIGWETTERTHSEFNIYGYLRTRDNRMWQINFVTGEVAPFLPELEVVAMQQLVLARNQLPDNWTESKRPWEAGLLFRTPDSLVWFSLYEEKTFLFTIPIALREKDFSSQLLGSNKILYLTSSLSTKGKGSLTNLQWADTAGTILDTREGVVTQPSYQRDHEENRWMISTFLPALIPYATSLAIASTDEFEQQAGITASEARLRLIQLSADVLLTLLIVGILFAVWFYRVCQSRGGSFSWLALVWIVLTGPFGFIILRYVTWHRSPVMQPIETRPGIDIIRLPQAG